MFFRIKTNKLHQTHILQVNDFKKIILQNRDIYDTIDQEEVKALKSDPLIEVCHPRIEQKQEIKEAEIVENKKNLVEVKK